MQVYGFCIRTLCLPVISVMIIGVMRSSYNEKQSRAQTPPSSREEKGSGVKGTRKWEMRNGNVIVGRVRW